VNMMLLATYMKKNGWEYEKAENGLLALQAFQSRPESFDVIFMGITPSLQIFRLVLNNQIRRFHAHNDGI
jgi:hypothetical protein